MTMNIMRGPRAVFLIAGTSAASALLASPAFAGSAGTSIGVNATVSANCTVSTTAIEFGEIDTTSTADVDKEGGLAVACTNGTGWSASAGLGGSTGATFAVRKMRSGTNRLNYSLYTNSGRTTVWGDGTSGSAQITGTGTGSTQNLVVYGRVFGNQTTVPAGGYLDSVSVTVTY
jgi:spore coat protein U-like protein